MHPIETLLRFLEQSLGIGPGVAARLLATLAVVGLLLVVRRLVRLGVARAFTDVTTRYQVNSVAAYVLGAIAIVALLRVWTEGFTGLPTYLGLASAGVAIALQDPIINLAGWIFILIRRPFSVGDRIQIGPHIGDVVDIRIFRFIMLEIGNWVHADQSTGRVLHIPNGWVFKNAIGSYDQPFGYIWNELEILVTFESNWRRAKEVLTQTVAEHAERLSHDAQEQIESAAATYHLKFSKLTPVVWTAVAESGVRLTMRYLCKPRERRGSASEIWESALDALAALPDVEIAYPTVRQFTRPAEPKSAATSVPDRS